LRPKLLLNEDIAGTQPQLIQIDKTYQVLASIASDGLTNTYITELKPSKEENLTQISAPPSHQLFLIREFIMSRFESEAQCEKFWENEKIFSKKINEAIDPTLSMKLVQDIMVEREGKKRLYLIFENIPKIKSLRLWFQQKNFAKDTTIEELIEHIILPLTKFLQKTHENGIIHRDLNYNTVYVQPYKIESGVIPDKSLMKRVSPLIGTWKTALNIDNDELFKVATVIEELPNGDETLYTPGFFAPEMGMGKKGAACTDIYEVGAILYYLITRGKYRIGESVETDFTLEPSNIIKEIPMELSKIVQKATQFEPKLRYHTFSEFQKDLEYYLNKEFDKLIFQENELQDLNMEINQIGLIVAQTGTIAGEISFLPFTLEKMILENGGFFRFGRDLLEKKPLYQNITELNSESEQCIIAYSRAKNLFMIYEGRNQNATEVDYQPLEKREWIPVSLEQVITVQNSPGVMIKIGSQF
jgi:serine/threonine protein kinase